MVDNKKVIVCAIIILVIGAGVLPNISSYSGDSLNSEVKKYVKVNCGAPPPSPPYGINLTKKVRYNGGSWGDTVTVNKGDEVEFKITITNTGSDYDLFVDKVYDILPTAGLSYLPGSSLVEGIQIDPNPFYFPLLKWEKLSERLGPLTVGDSWDLLFTAIAVECGEYENCANVTSHTIENPVDPYDEDCAIVNVICPYNIGIDVDKKVKEDCGGHPWHDYGIDIDYGGYNWVTYNITVTNTGDTILDIVVEDCLDDCLIYDPGYAWSYPDPTLVSGSCMRWEFDDVLPLESRYVEYRADRGSCCACGVKYWNDVTATGSSGCETVTATDQVWVRWECDDPCNPDIDVDKKVKEDCGGHPWHDYGIDIDYGGYNWVTYNITVTNTGDTILDIVVEDCLDDCLIYDPGYAWSYPDPTLVSGSCMRWEFDDVLPLESRYVEYRADRGSCCACGVKYWNDVTATGSSGCETVTATDQVWVRWECDDPCNPDIDVDKKVKEDCGGHPWHDYGIDIDYGGYNWVTYNITVTNTGDTILDIVVEDCLDDCLIYDPGYAWSYPDPTLVSGSCMRWEFDDVLPLESRYVEYRADRGSCCACGVKYWNDVTATGSSGCETVTATDQVWVRWECDDPCNPDIDVDKKVKEDCGGHPWHDYGIDIDYGGYNWVTYNITVTNTGDTILDIVVEDCLDDCLIYDPGYAWSYPDPTLVSGSCMRWEFDDVLPLESRYVEYRADRGSCCACGVKYWNDVTATGSSGCETVTATDQVWVRWECDDPCNPDIDVDKKVKEDCGGHPWHDYGIDIDYGGYNWVTYNITVTNTGDTILDIVVEDCLDDCLIYDPGYAWSYPDPTLVSGSCMRWEFDDVLPLESRYVEYRADRGSCCACGVKYWNDVTATGSSGCETVTATDQVWVRWECDDPCNPDIDVDKKVKEDCGGHPWHDYGIDIDYGGYNWVTYNITVTNTGDTILDIVVEDCLDDCLIYDPGYAWSYPDPTLVSGSCMRWEFDDVLPLESRYVEYRADRGSCCACGVKYWNDVTATGSSGCETVTATDQVWVRWECDDPCNPDIDVDKKVKEDCGGHPWHDYGIDIDYGGYNWVTYNITVTNTGDTILDIVVEDCLDDCLIYDPGYAWSYPDPTLVSGSCMRWEFDDVLPLESRYVEYRADRGSCCACGVKYWNDVTATGSSGCETVTATDQVWVRWECDDDCPPDIPSTPIGPGSGYMGTSYIYKTSTTDPDGDNIKYGWDWNGDGTVDEWTDFYSSGTTISGSHSWDTAGTYYIKVKAKDSNGEQSDFSPAKIVVITRANNPPNTPSTPNSPDSGYMGTSYIYKTSTTDPDGDTVKYGWDWDGDDVVDEWTDFYSSGTTISGSHSWDTAGTYYVKVKAEDSNGEQSDFSPAKIVVITRANNAPNKPSTPSGQISGKSGKSYEYSSTVTDPDGDQVYYWFDWGDGTNSGGWIGPYVSGEAINEFHIYASEGEYIVKVKAIDDPDGNGRLSDGTESEWSDPLTISMSKSNRFIDSLLWILEKLMERFPLLDKFFSLPIFGNLIN